MEDKHINNNEISPNKGLSERSSEEKVRKQNSNQKKKLNKKIQSLPDYKNQPAWQLKSFKLEGE